MNCILHYSNISCLSANIIHFYSLLPQIQHTVIYPIEITTVIKVQKTLFKNTAGMCTLLQTGHMTLERNWPWNVSTMCESLRCRCFFQVSSAPTYVHYIHKWTDYLNLVGLLLSDKIRLLLDSISHAASHNFLFSPCSERLSSQNLVGFYTGSTPKETQCVFGYLPGFANTATNDPQGPQWSWMHVGPLRALITKPRLLTQKYTSFCIICVKYTYICIKIYNI